MKFAVVKDLQEIKQNLARKKAEKLEMANKEIERDRLELEKNGLEETRRAIAERTQNFEGYEQMYKTAPTFIKSRITKPEIVKKEMPEFYKEAIESLQKKNNKKFEEFISKIYQKRLEEETVEFEIEKAKKAVEENEQKQIEFAEKVAGKKLKIIRIEEDGDGHKKIEMKYDEESTFTVTSEMVKEILEE